MNNEIVRGVKGRNEDAPVRIIICEGREHVGRCEGKV